MTLECPHLVHLADRALLRISGEDARPYLQGLISNDITKLETDHPLYAALLTPQGKYLFDFLLYQTADAILLDIPVERADELAKRLSLYRLRAKVVIEPQADLAVLASFGKGATTELPGWMSFADPRLAELGSRHIGSIHELPSQLDSAHAYEEHRLALGIPCGIKDMVVGKSTLQEGNFEELCGVSYDKGCYVGQELTARIKHRGLLKRRLLPVSIRGEAPLAGSVLRSADKEAGEMRSACGKHGIALLRVEHLAAARGDGLSAGSSTISLRSVPWLRMES